MLILNLEIYTFEQLYAFLHPTDILIYYILFYRNYLFPNYLYQIPNNMYKLYLVKTCFILLVITLQSLDFI